MKQDIQRITVAAAKPLFLFHLIYTQVSGIGMDWDLLSLGDISHGKARCNRHFGSSADTQRIQPFIGKYYSFILPFLVSFLFLPRDSRQGFCPNLAWCGTAYLYYRQTGMAHRCQRTHLRTCLLSLFQRYSPQIRPTDCNFPTCHLSIWGDYLAYISLFLPRQYVMGRTSQRWNHGSALCICIREPRASATGTFCGRGRGRRT